jgi:hypothetical protein
MIADLIYLCYLNKNKFYQNNIFFEISSIKHYIVSRCYLKVKNEKHKNKIINLCWNDNNRMLNDITL